MHIYTPDVKSWFELAWLELAFPLAVVTLKAPGGEGGSEICLIQLINCFN